MYDKLSRHRFLFEELVKRDFKKKYKRTVLGMAWSVLSPLLTLLVMKLVFTQFFGRTTAHYTIYLFCGNLIFSYFNEATSQGMGSLMGNAGIFTKVNVPKYLFLLSKNVQTLINFGLTLCVFCVFCFVFCAFLSSIVLNSLSLFFFGFAVFILLTTESMSAPPDNAFLPATTSSTSLKLYLSLTFYKKWNDPLKTVTCIFPIYQNRNFLLQPSICFTIFRRFFQCFPCISTRNFI